ncbi:PRC-barrel domain-containing protein [Vannielia litorea]|uniref:PRC-barrel domain-containing protein n=1 Tax=Vannielia litorea TaxID=1217970 RepID=A0A1N6EWP2_9RHOB|nr:PRC-barrel domain-containing protein [Vannielia litorea]SIN87353.1 PRC-barrel domain-containing protein [Vannielia litorea]
MKRILATTALTASLVMPAFAQDAAAPEATATPEAGTEMAAGGFIQSADPQDVMASDFIGKRVYAMSEEMEYGDEGVAEADAAWEDIGEVSDVILARTGEVEGVIVDIGGFLGIGEKPVALTMDSLNLVADADAPGEYFVTVNSSREALDQAPAFEFTEPAPMEQAEATDGSVATPLEETPGEEVDMAEGEDVTADPMAADPNNTEEMTEMAEAGDNAADEAEAEVTEELAEGEAAVEEAGDEAAQEMAEAGDAVEEAGDEAAQEMAEAGDAVEEAGDEATQEMAEAGDAVEEAGDEAAQEMAEAPAESGSMEEFTRDGYSTVMVTELSSEDLTGLSVYDPNDNRVGEISEVLISSDGVVTDAVIDVGGFLGIGEKPVAISFSGISLQKQAEGDDLRAYVNTTEEQLKSFPEYEDG